MKRIAFACIALASLLAVAPASAVTNENGDILITAAAVNAGGITPGDTAGFPVTISLPGTYRLTTNLTVTTAVNGIEVRANEVTIEMGGHTLAGSGVGRNGITSFNRSLGVQHGTVRGFTNDGIRTIAPYLSVSNMRVLANARYGVILDTSAAQGDNVLHVSVSDSVISQNQYGIRCDRFCQVSRNDVSGNAADGVTITDNGGLVIGNMIAYNGGSGLVAPQPTAVGDNSLMFNAAAQSLNSFIALHPNACSPACPAPP